MTAPLWRVVLASVLCLVAWSWPAVVRAQGAIAYTLSFEQRVHRLMRVDVTFPDVPQGVLELRFSRSSPGRYAVHEFAKNVYDVVVVDGAGRVVPVTRPNPHQWNVPRHDGTVRVSYTVFGDRVDGTYLGVDSTHAHINMPAALMWARGLAERPVQVRFSPPVGVTWRVATQLFPTSDPYTFTAPNLQYLMDSPSEFGDFDERRFTVPDGDRRPEFRVAAHHRGDEAHLDAFTADIEKVVREARNVFGEFAPFDGNTYTFIVDLVPWANADGMEHRNSTIVTSPSSLRGNRADLLGTAAHEFFHAWNVERIRPAALEPFNFEDANMAGELWLAEGFTSYYEPLITRRAGLTTIREFVQQVGQMADAVLTRPGRLVRSVEEMSRHAPFVDAAASIDPTNFENAYISYYSWGAAIGLGLDLTLRVRTDGRVTLDHFMRALWRSHGKPGGRAPGYVEKPYTVEDLARALAEVSDDAAFANDFFARYIQGREVVDYEALLAAAGILVRPVSGSGAYLGRVRFETAPGGVRVASAAPIGSPAFDAGLDRDDLIVAMAGVAVSSEAELRRILASRRPGEELAVSFERRGTRVTSTIRLGADPRREVLLAEDADRPVSAAQRRFREAWLGLGGQ